MRPHLLCSPGSSSSCLVDLDACAGGERRPERPVDGVRFRGSAVRVRMHGPVLSICFQQLHDDKHEQDDEKKTYNRPHDHADAHSVHHAVHHRERLTYLVRRRFPCDYPFHYAELRALKLFDLEPFALHMFEWFAKERVSQGEASLCESP